MVLWGPDAIREVLDQSADVYASDSGAKGKGMRHFQPDALTLSRGEEWRDRRAFNESVLATSERVHPAGEPLPGRGRRRGRGARGWEARSTGPTSSGCSTA